MKWLCWFFDHAWRTAHLPDYESYECSRCRYRVMLPWGWDEGDEEEGTK